jgi:hypothetical protein
MAKLTTAQPILIGTATGRSDHRTNTAQLQQTTTLRMCRADLDPPRADGLLRRTVGPAFRARTTHRHRIRNHALKTHPVTYGRDAVTFTMQSRNTFSSVHRRPMSLVQRLGIAAFVVAITGVGLSPAVEAHSAHHHNSRKNKKRRPTSGGYKHGYRRAIENSYRPHYRRRYRSYSPLYGLMVSPMPRRVIVTPTPWMVPVHPHHHGTLVHVGHGFHL